MLFGLNAHINYDLPQALLAVITPADFDDPAVRRRREADHRHVDAVLQARVGAEDAELGAVSRVTLLDRLLRPANRAASRRFLAEARAKVLAQRGRARPGPAARRRAVRRDARRAGDAAAPTASVT